MSATTAPAEQRRMNLSLSNEGAVIADIRRLRKGYTQAGKWTLPQVCWHLDTALQMRMKPGPHPLDNTPEQDARRDVLRQVLATGQLPDGIVAPEPMVPPPECGDDAIDACIARLEQFIAFPGPIAPHRLFGQMPDGDARRLNLIHCARHLSFLTPTTPAKREHLTFNDEHEAIAEIERLQKGCTSAGEWSLEQICWHCRAPLQPAVDNPTDREPTPEDTVKQKWFAGMIAERRRSCQRIETSSTMLPPVDSPRDESQRLVAALRKLAAWDKPRLLMGPMGPMPLVEARAFHLYHLGHHLSYLVLTTQA